MIKGVLTQAITTAHDIWTGDYPRRPIATFDDQGQAGAFFDDLTDFTKGHLRRFRDGYLTTNDSWGCMVNWAREHDTFPNLCKGAQEIIGHNLLDTNLQVAGFSTEHIGLSRFPHCAAVVPVQIKSESSPRHVLMDPTIKQFALPPNLYEAVDLNPAYAGHSPAQCLKRSEAGQEIWQTLNGRGYIELTPQRAATYLQAFFPTQTFAPDDALNRLVAKPFQEDPLLGRAWVQDAKVLGFRPRQTVGHAAALLSAPSTP